jgi:cytochrome c556
VFISTRSVWAFALGAALLLGGAADATAQGRGGAPMTPQAYRVSLMQQFQANMAALTAVQAGTVGAPSHILGRALVLQQLAMMARDAFPVGSAGEGSRALPAIWTDTTNFMARVQAIQTAANELVTAARGGNAEQITAARTALNGTCGACHMAFRGPAPGN